MRCMRLKECHENKAYVIFYYIIPIISIQDTQSLMQTTQKIKKPLCSVCDKEMKFALGDTIHGDKWYHKDCVPLIKIKIN